MQSKASSRKVLKLIHSYVTLKKIIYIYIVKVLRRTFQRQCTCTYYGRLLCLDTFTSLRKVQRLAAQVLPSFVPLGFAPHK